MKTKIMACTMAAAFLIGSVPVRAAAQDHSGRLKEIREEIAQLQSELDELEREILPESGSDDAPVLKNADDAPLDSVFYISDEDCVENTPYGNGLSSGFRKNPGFRETTGYLSGTLVTYGASGDTKVQLFTSVNDNSDTSAEPSILYYRSSRAGVWTKWHRLSDAASLSSSNIAIRKKMLAPYLDAEGNPTVEATDTPNPEYVGDNELIFSDFNDAPNNSIYQIDLDCDPSVMANNPIPGCSSVLITTAFSYWSRHGIVQICIGLKSGTMPVYYRYCYAKTDEYAWTRWERLLTESEPALTLGRGTGDEVTVSAADLGRLIDEVKQTYGALTGGILEIAPSAFEQGSWGYSAKQVSSSRLRSAVSYKVTEGTKVHYSNPSLRLYLGLLEAQDSESYLQKSGWIEPGETEGEYIIMFDGFLNIIMESADGSEITPADFDGYVKLEY